MKEYKVVVLGPGGVGKSALTVQFISGKFVERYDPTVEDFYRKEIEVANVPAILEILDTAGTEQFASMRDLYIKNGQGFIIVFSLTSRQSFQDVRLIRDQIVRVKNTEHVPIVLAANKCDVGDVALREVSADEGLKLANEWGVPYIETTAKNSSVVNALFTEIVKEMNVHQLVNGTHHYHSRSRDKRKKKGAAVVTSAPHPGSLSHHSASSYSCSKFPQESPTNKDSCCCSCCCPLCLLVRRICCCCSMNCTCCYCDSCEDTPRKSNDTVASYKPHENNPPTYYKQQHGTCTIL